MNVDESSMMNAANTPPSSPSKSHRRQQSVDSEEVLQQRLQRIVLLRRQSPSSKNNNSDRILLPREAAPDRRRSTPETNRSSTTTRNLSGALRRRTKSLDKEDREFRGASLQPCSSARLSAGFCNTHEEDDTNDKDKLKTLSAFQMDNACPSSPKKPQRNTSRPRTRHTTATPKPIDTTMDKNRQSPRKPARFPEEIVTWSRFSPAPPVCRDKTLASMTYSPKKPFRSPSPGRLLRSADDQTAACTETPFTSSSNSSHGKRQNVLDHSAHHREQLELLSTQVDKFSLCEL